MRLLSTKTIEVKEFAEDQIPQYAILSHTWSRDHNEVLLGDMETGRAQTMKGYAKVRRCCDVARANGFEYVWIDTCCIDKTSSAELSEAINSMYRYYQKAEVCYGYLADVSSLSEFGESKWFTRGWTLQELIAPPIMLFFNKHWSELGTKGDLAQIISDRTGVPKAILSGDEHLETSSVAQRMSWAADRQTTRAEDRAYSLMGIFDINMPLLYGEGDRAFVRLQEEIMRVSDDQSIFAWRHLDNRGGILATTPAAFRDSGDIVTWNPLTLFNTSFTITNKGVHINAPFVMGEEGGLGLVVLSCARLGDRDQLIAIHVRDLFMTMDHFRRFKSDEFGLVNLGKLNPILYRMRDLCLSSHSRGAHSKEAQIGSPPNQYSPSDQNTAEEITAGESNNEAKQDSHLELLSAASEGREADVKRLLTQSGISASFRDHEGRTALSYAAASGHERIVRCLLGRSDPYINGKDKRGLSPLAHATIGGHRGIVWLLLVRNEIEAKVVDDLGRPLPCLAARHNQEDLVSMLLVRKEFHDSLLDSNRRSPLSHAAEMGHAALVGMLLRSGRVLPDLKDDSGLTPCWYAAVNGHDAVVSLLLNTGLVDINAKNGEGVDLIWAVAWQRHTNVMRTLLQNHNNVDVLYKSQTLLHMACSEGYEDYVELLLDHGAKVGFSRSHDRTSPIFQAASRGHVAIMKILICREHQAVIESRHPIKGPLLYECVSQGHAEIVRLLLEAGVNASVNHYYTSHISFGTNGNFQTQPQPAFGSGGSFQTQRATEMLNLGHCVYGDSITGVQWNRIVWNTALNLAANSAPMAHDYTILKLLLQYGADTEVPVGSKNGKTVLLLQIQSGWEQRSKVIDLLLEFGADIDRKNSEGSTPLTHALRWGSMDQAKFLLARGADPCVQVEMPLHSKHSTAYDEVKRILQQAQKSRKEAVDNDKKEDT